MSAWDASPSEALGVLENSLPQFTASVLSGNVVPWFGSAISGARLPDVPTLLLRALTHLFEHARPGDVACPYFSTLTEIVALGGATPVDLTSHPAKWDPNERGGLLKRLTAHYAIILAKSVAAPGGPVTIRWDILDLIRTYSDPAIEPDAEHGFIAMLVEEGIFRDMVTTNWDALIEKADANCACSNARIHSIACNEELDTTTVPTLARLYKIHGCAEKASHDEAKYKPFMVATRVELGNWLVDAARRPFREALSTLLRQRGVIFVGLSGQDFNLQVAIISASFARTAFAAATPRVAFCATALTEDHRTILTALYGDDEYQHQRGTIDQSAVLPLYGKPLLGALCLKVLIEKATRIAQRFNSPFATPSAGFIAAVMEDLKNGIIAHFDGRHSAATSDECWRQVFHDLTTFLGWFVALYRSQTSPTFAGSYPSLLPGTLAELDANPNVEALNCHWLMWSVGVLFAGTQRGLWNLSFRDPATSHPLVLMVNGVAFETFVIANSISGLPKLINSGLLDTTRSASIVLHPAGQRPATARRSPARRLPTGVPNPLVELWMADIFERATSDDDIFVNAQLDMV